jgi:CRISPR system Cascade subunit CasE
MYISRMNLDTHRAAHLGIYGEHQALWDLFADHHDRERDFIYRALENAQFISVSRRIPKDEKKLWNIQVKEYDPKLKTGDRVFFSLRINAVRKSRDEKGKQVRHDIVQDLRVQMLTDGFKEADLPGRTVLAHEAAIEWLRARREELGFEMEEEGLMVDSYQRHQVRKRGGSRPITLSILDLKGFARVIEPERARKTLMQGIGCAKGLGCGMMLVRRA